MTQPALPLAYRAALSQSDFILSAANAEAVALLARWPDWPAPVLLLTGPEGCGKSHLAGLFAVMAGDAATVMDDADRMAADPALFHAVNRAVMGEGSILLTSRLLPADWPNCLPDLRSRLALAIHARIDEPDDDLIAALMPKLLRDRGLLAPASVIAYVAARIERSHAALHAVVARLDEAALAERRELTVPLAAQVLAGLSSQFLNNRPLA